LKRQAQNQICLAHHFAHHRLHDDMARAAIENEARAIAADLQAFTDAYSIHVVKRTRKPSVGSQKLTSIKC
jgi:hypothetical protein